MKKLHADLVICYIPNPRNNWTQTIKIMIHDSLHYTIIALYRYCCCVAMTRDLLGGGYDYSWTPIRLQFDRATTIQRRTLRL